MELNSEDYIRSIGTQDDADIDLSLASLALCAPYHEGISQQRYIHHFEVLVKEVARRHKDLLAAGAVNDAATQLAALKHILVDKYDYAGDDDTPGDLQNVDMMRVIDRARGLPIMLGVLYIYAARLQGWQIDGLNMPGRFLCRIEKGGQRIIFSPFDRAKVMEAYDLRAQVKQYLGERAELSSTHFDSLSNREILVRMQNTIKYRLIDHEDYDEALRVIERIRMLAPDEYRLLLDAGVLYARVNKPLAAIRALEGYIEKAPDPRDRYEAGLMLDHIRASMEE